MTTHFSSGPGLPGGDPGPASAPRRAGLTLRMSAVLFAVMSVVFLVAIVFAANANTVIGWIVAVVFGGWLAIFAFLVFTLRSAAQRAGRALEGAQEEFARQRADHAPLSGTSVIGERDTLLDEKLEHSFAIIQVQRRVIAEERAKGPDADDETVERALETIDITASNARDMLRPGRGGSSEAVTGTVL